MDIKMLKAALAGLVLSVSVFANAGLIVLGDVNAIALDNTGNKSLFTNILGDDDQVLFNTKNSSFSSSLNTYYNSLAGVSTSSTSSSITSGLLSTYDLLVLDFGFTSNAVFTAQEVTALTSFMNAGNNVIFFGETGYSAGVTNFNNILTDIGSSIRFTNDKTPGGYATSTDIATTVLTTGVSSVKYAWASYLTGGTSLVKHNNRSIIASEGTFHQVNATIPEPSSLAIFALGIIGLASRKFKKQ